ncbi:kinesin-like protein KIF23 [Drosophila biarmipes]|uniref:kinesin-like protein KIF23 n=1 Tax=Drosophila biarmipes TaxID=125945 RepID=UPI0021CCC6BB|nr:kinesin-like protein KIF23 [Drosophila biarmipes]
MSQGNRRSQSVNRPPPYALHRGIRNISECRRCQQIDPTLLDPLDSRRIQQQLAMVFLRVRPESEPSDHVDLGQTEEQRKQRKLMYSERPWMMIKPPHTILVSRSAMPAAPGAATGAPGVGTGPPRAQPNYDIEFRFRRIFSERASSALVYKHISEPILRQVFLGGSGLILITGAPGSGKTHSLLGSRDCQGGGILRRTLESIFRCTGSDLVERYLVQANNHGAGFTCVPARTAQKLAAQEDRMLQGSEPSATTPNRPECRWQLNGVKIHTNHKRRACFLGAMIVQDGCFYDLLDHRNETDGRPPPLSLREDRKGRCFAVGANRLEIRGIEEAELMIKAALQKRDAWSDPGGSHLVINIYLVTYDNIRRSELLECGQITLVRLLTPSLTGAANSRRSGGALKTVYTVRNCINCLHSNQIAVLKGKPPKKKPPSRECSLTQLLRHFFDVRNLACVVCLATITQERGQVLDNIRALRFAEETVYINGDCLNDGEEEEKPKDADSGLFATFLDKNFRPNFRAIRTVLPIDLPPYTQVQSLIDTLKSQITRRKHLMVSSKTLSKDFLERMHGRRDEIFALQATALKELRRTIYETSSLVDQLEVVHEPVSYGKISVQAQQAEKRAQISENLLHGRNEQLERHVSQSEGTETVEPTGDARKRKAQKEESVKTQPIWHHY